MITEQEFKSALEELQREAPEKDSELAELVEHLIKMETFKDYGFKCQVRWLDSLPEDFQLMMSLMALMDKESIEKIVKNFSAMIITTMLLGMRIGRKQILGEMLEKK